MFHQDGRCASEAETIHVEMRAGCSTGGESGGSASAPFCAAAMAMDLAKNNSAKRLVMIRGTQISFVAPTLDRQLSVIAPAGAVIAAGGAGVAIRSTGGDLYLRGLTVRGSEQVGIQVTGGIIRLDRCTVQANQGGGLSIDGAGFEVTNTIIVENGGPATQPFLWGGVLLLNVGSHMPQVFRNNTVTANAASGVHCSEPFTLSTSILAGNTAAPTSGLCTVVECCGSGNPLLTPMTYRLTPGSPCVDRLPSSMSTSQDIDGNSRPQPAGGQSDCGADELIR
jgi:hypothetical protein